MIQDRAWKEKECRHFQKERSGQTPPCFSLLQCHLQVRDRAWVERKPQVRLHGYLQEKGGGIHNPITRRWAAAQDPGRKEEILGKEQCLPESQTYLSLPVKLGGCVLPDLISAPDVEGIELYSLLMSYGERDILPQEPFDSTLTVGIIPSQRANGRSSKRGPTLNSI